nr:putative integron gene cassette protein [uncultured bacterium]
MKGNVIIGGMMIATAIYALSFAYFWPEKLRLPPNFPLRRFRLCMIIAAVCGAVTIVAPMIFHDGGR